MQRPSADVSKVFRIGIGVETVGGQASIVSPTAVKLWGAEYGKHPAGTGPYQFVAWTDRRTMRRNSDYRSGAANIEHLVFTKIEDSQQRVVALQSGSIDIDRHRSTSHSG